MDRAAACTHTLALVLVVLHQTLKVFFFASLIVHSVDAQ
jgi:hypothetical protein